VFYALSTALDQGSFGNVSFCKHFFKRLLLFKRTMSVSLHRLIRASMGSFPTAFAAPSRNREYPDTFLHSVEVVTCTHERSMPCCTTEPRASSTLPWCGAQSMIQANHCSSPRPADPPFCKSIHLLYYICRPIGALVLPLHTMDDPIGRPARTPVPAPMEYG
jgi:hypothetical protein